MRPPISNSQAHRTLPINPRRGRRFVSANGWSNRIKNMKKHKSTDRDLLLTNKHGGIIHTLESFEPGMVAKMKCGLLLAQWRDADSTGRKCKRCK